MNKTITKVAGMASVAVFVGLLTLIVYTQVQSEPGDVVEEQYPPATHPLVGFGPEDLPKTPFFDAEVMIVDWIERLSVDCSGAAPGLKIETKEDVPQDATIRITAQEAPTTDEYGNTRWKGVGSDEVSAGGRTSDEGIALSNSLRSHLADGADSVAVIIAYTDADGFLFGSIAERIAAADLVC